MCERIDGKVGARETPIGLLPHGDDLNCKGLKIPQENLKELLKVDADAWQAELSSLQEHFAQFGDRLPPRMKKQLDALKERLKK
jgi:phosphoenolpyruvate carboxykinase (GTP)